MNIKAIESFAPRRPGKGITMRQRFELGRQRRALAGLNDHLLADIGLNRAEATREARRPIWDAPAHWLG